MYNRVNWKDGQTELCDTNFNIMDKGIADIDATLSQVSNSNLLINGDFQVWQRGTNFSPDKGLMLYSADRWCSASLNFISISKIDTGGIRISNSTEFTANSRFHQFLEVPKSLQGKTVTLSMSIKSNVNSKVVGLSIFSYDRQTVYGSKTITLSTGAKIYSVTATIPVGQDVIGVGLALSTGSTNYLGLTTPIVFPVCTIDIDWVKLEMGSVSTPFCARLYAEELTLCKRYYEVGQGQIISAFGAGYLCGINFQVEKRACPECTVSYITDLVTWASISYSSIITNVYSIAEIDGSGYTTNRLYRLGTWTADAEIYQK
jgi:hypothetical protein